MLKLLSKIGILGKNDKGEPTGLASVLMERTGKISFRRSFPIVILTTIVAPEIAANGLTWQALVAIGIAGATYALPTILNKD